MAETTDRIGEIEKRCSAATEGPWKAIDSSWEYSLINTENEHLAEVRISSDVTEDNQDHYESIKNANATFIAHARSDIPWLLEDRERLIQELRSARELLTAALPYVDPDDVLNSPEGKARVRALHNKIRAALKE